MVSVKQSSFSYILLSLIAIMFLMLFAVKGYASQPCCKNGKLSTCADLGGGLAYDLSSCMAEVGPMDPGTVICMEGEVANSYCSGSCLGGTCYRLGDCSFECRYTSIGGGGQIELPECTPGDEEYMPDGCNTKTNPCCANGKWAGFGNTCTGEASCSSNQCWNGSICENKPDTSCSCVNGTCSKFYYCSDGGGWEGGTASCKCNPGYTSKNLAGPCYKEESMLVWSCSLAGSSCRNPVNNRHNSPCQSLATTCDYVGQTRSYYSCQTCYNCVCKQETIRPVL